jgi:hypothetical protein
MATADVIQPTDVAEQRRLVVALEVPGGKPMQHNVRTVLNYYKDPEDGTPPAPFYVGYVHPEHP